MQAVGSVAIYVRGADMPSSEGPKGVDERVRQKFGIAISRRRPAATLETQHNKHTINHNG